MYSDFSQKGSQTDKKTRNCKKDDTHQLTVLATKTSHALAGVAAISIETTPLVQAWVVFTLINILFTVHSFVPTTNRSITQMLPHKK
jgi:hypothetical protein